MSKIEEAKDLLNALGLPPPQRNELAALTLLAPKLANDFWKNSEPNKDLYLRHTNDAARNTIPLKDQSGREYRLSPGKHNQLQVATVEQFAPRFAPGAKLLYLGDAAYKTLVMDADGLAQVGFPANKHSKLPDIVMYLPKKNWLFLIEVVTSHGPISPKRYQELEKMLAKSSAGRVYVSVFPDFKEFNRHSRNTAWETEVWIAEAPDHLIHYNGDKLLGPRHLPKRKTK